MDWGIARPNAGCATVLCKDFSYQTSAYLFITRFLMTLAWVIIGDKNGIRPSFSSALENVSPYVGMTGS